VRAIKITACVARLNLKNYDWSGNMVDLITKSAEEVSLSEIVKCLSATQSNKFLERYNLKKLSKIFDDEDMMATCNCLFENSLNVSSTAKMLYMHRNTLIYRLDKVKRISGLDIRTFNDAVTFSILNLLYCQK
jgi:carbohydrate diacid regulator